MGVSELASGFVAGVVRERSSSCKQVQVISGAKPLLYWAGTYLWDILIIAMPIGAILVLILFR